MGLSEFLWGGILKELEREKRVGDKSPTLDTEPGDKEEKQPAGRKHPGETPLRIFVLIIKMEEKNTSLDSHPRRIIRVK